MNNLSICSWNANGLRHKVGELIDFISRTKIDIVLISETRLNEHVKLKIRNYKCLGKDKGSTAGGLAMLIRNNIPYKETYLTEDISIEYLGIKLASNVNIIAVYNSPNALYTAKDIEKLINIGNKVILEI